MAFHSIVLRENRNGEVAETLAEFTTMIPFGKSALYQFRTYVRDNYPEAKLVAPSFGSLAGFKYTLPDGKTTVELT